MAAEVGVKVESTGLACWAWDGGALRADETKEEEEPDRHEVAMVASGGRVAAAAAALARVSSTPPFCESRGVTGTRRATARPSGGRRCSR
jgi:hypothetical protein